MTNTHPDYGFYHTHVNRNAIASQMLVYDIITFFPHTHYLERWANALSSCQFWCAN